MLTFAFPCLGGVVLHVAVTPHRDVALNDLVDKYNYPVLPLQNEGDKNEDCIGWTFVLDNSNSAIFLWLNSDLHCIGERVGLLGITASLSHELLHVAQRVAERMSTTIDKAEEPIAYMIGAVTEVVITYLKWRRHPKSRKLSRAYFDAVCRRFSCTYDEETAEHG